MLSIRISHVVAVVAVIAALLVGAYWGRFAGNQKPGGNQAAEPETAKPTKESEKWERQIEALNLAVAQLSEAQKLALATKYQRPEILVVPGAPGLPGAVGSPGKDGQVVLAETKTTGEAPAGVSILSTANPSTGVVTNTVVANPVKFWGAPLRWRVFAEGMTGEATWDTSRFSYAAGLEFDMVRMGSVHFQPKVEWFREPVGLTGEVTDGAKAGLRISWEPSRCWF